MKAVARSGATAAISHSSWAEGMGLARMVRRKPLVIVTRKLPEVIETRMMELFETRLNESDAP